MPKLKGLAEYAQAHAAVYRRIEAVAKVGSKLRVVDLTNAEVRTAVAESEDAKKLFDSDVAIDF
jgi:type III restriction enzyme